MVLVMELVMEVARYYLIGQCNTAGATVAGVVSSFQCSGATTMLSMGFLASLFGRDWAAELEKVERDLANDEPVLALDRARKAAKGAPEGGLRDRAVRLVEEARAALVARARSRAEASEREGNLLDAIDWIGSALANEDASVVRAELEAWRSRLNEAQERERSPLLGSRATQQHDDHEHDDEGDSHDPEWDAWLSTLRDDLVVRWEEAPEAVAFAAVATNGGDAEGALVHLEHLPADGVVGFERGRALLALGRFADAVAPLELAWRELGSTPIDTVGSVSIPAMWAEAKLGLEAAAEVVERLADLADPRGDGGLEPALVHAHALALTGAIDHADTALRELARFAPKDSRLPLERASVLARGGRRDEAIRVLDAAVAPTCRAGCTTPPHLPSLRTLAGLLLDQGAEVERARELLAIVAHRNGGSLSATDHLLLARYYDATGDGEAAVEARAAAEELAGLDVDVASPVLVAGGRRRVL
jgi:tetratricopeptide (TPR) repeat protein